MKDDLTLIISAVRYIEANLREKLSLEDIAGEVGFSKYYFTRLFARYTGQSPYDYYRGRKLTETIQFIQDKKCKIIDAAFEYGYSSPEVFARACATVFGKSPSAIRKEIVDGTFQGVSPISEGYLWFINRYSSEPKLVFLDGVEFAGVGYFSDHMSESLYNMSIDRLKSVGHNREEQTYKITWLERQPMGYMNFVGRPMESVPEEAMLLTKRLPKMAYLVFDYNLQGDEIRFFHQYIYHNLIPEKGYEVLAPLNIEVLSGVANNRSSKLYIPVIPS